MTDEEKLAKGLSEALNKLDPFRDGNLRIMALSIALGATLADVPLELRESLFNAAFQTVTGTMDYSDEQGLSFRGRVRHDG